MQPPPLDLSSLITPTQEHLIMEQTYLGRSGLVVSELCLGTMTFGGACDLETSRVILDRFREAGGTFLDTADVYTQGRSEEILGQLVADDRDDLVIASKAYATVGEGPNDRSSSRRHLTRAVEDSLDRLGTDYLDLYQLHAWDPTTPLEETLSTLEDLVRSGKVLHVGVSNFVGWQIERACRLQDVAGYDRFVSLQPQYSLVERGIELETLPAARANGLGILAWSPLAAGFLTGKYERGGDAEGKGSSSEAVAQPKGSGSEAVAQPKGRFAQFVDNIDDGGWDTLDAVREIAQAHDAEPATVAIAWLCAQPDVIPIIGATKPEHLDATLAAPDLALTDEDVARLAEIGEPPSGYPWDFGAVDGRPARPAPGDLGGDVR